MVDRTLSEDRTVTSRIMLLQSWNQWLRGVVVITTAEWHHGVVVITTIQLHSTNPELRFCAGSNPARDVLEIRDGEDL